ncbi:tetratricopeptide repeat protein [Pseudanabaena sp. 'Roaring Creek']|uniref:tetratricopeptide repeat protein n=1 Tax=Pseudanabaena sp. 'Roaring Creek' TaxID=1681830 RepID=UPI0006D82312|nr:tetratricopeptide repeat protein [Pseudanabaena sp. 'Roaring Creek']
MSGRITASLVQLSQSSGLELNFYIDFKEKIIRRDQKFISLQKYVQKHPQGWKKRLEFADLLCQMGNWQQAIAEYQQVIALQPQLLNVWLQLGRILRLMRLKADAVEVYQKALLRSEKKGTQDHIHGLIAVCRDQSHRAIESFTLAAVIEPDNIAHWMALAEVHWQRENPLGVLTALEKVDAIAPNDFLALIYSYDALIALGDFSVAIDKLSRAIAIAPDDMRTIQRQIDRRCQMRLVSGQEGKLTKKMLTSLLNLSPHNADAQKSLAYYHILRGEWQLGVKVLAALTAQYPNYPHAWYYYGKCLFETGEYEQAIAAMGQAYHLYPHDCEIYLGLCEMLATAKQLQDLQPLIEEMLLRFPDRWRVWATAGRIFVESLEQKERGCILSQQAIALDPQLANPWILHGRVLALAGKHPAAIHALEQGKALLRIGGLQLIPVALWLGDSYSLSSLSDRGDRAIAISTAINYWQAACQGCQDLQEHDPAMTSYWLGKALTNLGDCLGGIQAYENALKCQLLYPIRGEVEMLLRQLKGKKLERRV